MRLFWVFLSIVIFVGVCNSPVSAQLTSPEVGWKTNLNEIHHDVIKQHCFCK